VTVINPLGLHARAAAQLVKRAGQFSSRITLARVDGYGTEVNAKSILNVLTLAASSGYHLRLKAEGEDSQAAVAAITELFATGFGEI
ncbi:MAG: HPr family phosphocarrier protein, partial [Pyrinomonadaceae bacterium]